MARYEEDSFDSVVGAGSLRQDMLELSESLTEAIWELEQASTDWAEKDNEMRKAKAKAYLKATGKNKEERESRADAYFEAERLAANIAEGVKVAKLERVRSLRAQLSALQSLVYADRAENESIRYGQTQRT